MARKGCILAWASLFLLGGLLVPLADLAHELARAAKSHHHG